MSEIIDKLMSRKLWLVVAATALLAFGMIEEDTWKWIASVYLGAEALQRSVGLVKQ
jgi:hypothetical protein